MIKSSIFILYLAGSDAFSFKRNSLISNSNDRSLSRGHLHSVSMPDMAMMGDAVTGTVHGLLGSSSEMIRSVGWMLFVFVFVVLIDSAVIGKER